MKFGMELTTGTTEVQQQPLSSSHLSAENSPFISSTGTGEEDDDLSAEQVRIFLLRIMKIMCLQIVFIK